MKNRMFALLCLCLLVMNLAGPTVADVPAKRKAKAQTNQLAHLLPATDGIVTLDVKRFFSIALPKVLSANQPMLDKITVKVESVKSRTGIDIRQFDALVAGITAKQISPKKYDLDHVVIARGQVSSASIIGAARLAVNGKYREEKAGGTTIYIVSAKDVAAQINQTAPVAAKPDLIDKLIGKQSGELALAAVDANTIAFGEPELVRQTVNGVATVKSDLIPLLAKRETSVISFAGKMPNGMSGFLPLDNDELGRNIDSIRYVYGDMDIAGDAATLNVTARTLQNTQATALKEALEGAQIFLKALLGGSKGQDKQVYARMIENAKFSSSGNEVMLNLQVPQSDIDILVAGLK
ncbi:MAG: hypothetical protein AB7F88_16155 [Pyrinomonadaceae bacterium]